MSFLFWQGWLIFFATFFASYRFGIDGRGLFAPFRAIFDD